MTGPIEDQAENQPPGQRSFLRRLGIWLGIPLTMLGIATSSIVIYQWFTAPEAELIGDCYFTEVRRFPELKRMREKVAISGQELGEIVNGMSREDDIDWTEAEADRAAQRISFTLMDKAHEEFLLNMLETNPDTVCVITNKGSGTAEAVELVVVGKPVRVERDRVPVLNEVSSEANEQTDLYDLLDFAPPAAQYSVALGDLRPDHTIRVDIWSRNSWTFYSRGLRLSHSLGPAAALREHDPNRPISSPDEPYRLRWVWAALAVLLILSTIQVILLLKGNRKKIS